MRFILRLDQFCCRNFQHDMRPKIAILSRSIIHKYGRGTMSLQYCSSCHHPQKPPLERQRDQPDNNNQSSQIRLDGELLRINSVFNKKEKYHTVRTPRLFLLERHGYKDIAVLPPKQKSGGSMFDKGPCETLISAILEQRRMNSSDVNKLFSMLSCLRYTLLREVIQGEKFKLLLSKVVASLPEMSQDDFASFLGNLASLRYKIKLLTLATYVPDCCEALSDHSLQWLENWPLKDLMKATDAFNLLRVRNRRLIEKFYGEVEKNVDKFSQEELLQAIYLLGEIRNGPPHLMAKLETRISYLVQRKEVSFVEIGTIGTALFKSEWRILSVQLMNMLRDLVFATKLSRHPGFHVVGILKVFRHHHYAYSTLFETVGDQVAPLIASWYSIKTVMQFTLTFASLHIFHKGLMDATARRVVTDIEQCRSKDVAKLLWSFATLNYEPPGTAHLFETLLRRMDALLGELRTYPIYLATSMLSLAYLNVYPVRYLNLLFSDKFLQHIKDYEQRNDIDIRGDLFILHCSAQLECPEQLQHSLDMDYLIGRPLPPSLCPDIEEELKRSPVLKVVIECLGGVLGGTEYFKVHCILPHMNNADIEICLDEHHRPLPVNRWVSTESGLEDSCNSVQLDDDVITQLGGMSHDDSDVPDPLRVSDGDTRQDDYKGRLKHVQLPQPVPSEETRVVIQASPKTQYHVRGKKLLGLHNMKRRHLEKLGYHVVEIPYYDWELVSGRGDAARQKYLRQKMFEMTEKIRSGG